MFQDKERAEEAKFAHDEETRFLAAARADKLFAQWAGQRAGASAEEAEIFTHALLAVPVDAQHDAQVVRLAESFLQRHGHPASAEELTAALRRCLAAPTASVSPQANAF